MPNITRTTSRPSSPKSKLLIVRQPVKSVGRHDHHERTPLRLAIGVIVALGVIISVWLLGHLGYRLGFAPLVRAPDLLGEPGSGLVTGTLIVISVPRVIFRAGLAQPFWLMVAFAMIALPAASLAAAKPLAPGGPRPKKEITYLASIGALLALLSAAALIWWTGSSARMSLVGALPINPAHALQWHHNLQTAAGLDVLAVVTAALWVVLALRLPIQLWLRAITASAAFFTLVVVSVAMAMTNAASAQIAQPRSLCAFHGDLATTRVILGSTPQHTATLLVTDDLAIVELHHSPDAIAVTARQSIVNYLTDHTPHPP